MSARVCVLLQLAWRAITRSRIQKKQKDRSTNAAKHASYRDDEDMRFLHPYTVDETDRDRPTGAWRSGLLWGLRGAALSSLQLHGRARCSRRSLGKLRVWRVQLRWRRGCRRQLPSHQPRRVPRKVTRWQRRSLSGRSRGQGHAAMATRAAGPAGAWGHTARGPVRALCQGLERFVGSAARQHAGAPALVDLCERGRAAQGPLASSLALAGWPSRPTSSAARPRAAVDRSGNQRHAAGGSAMVASCGRHRALLEDVLGVPPPPDLLDKRHLGHEASDVLKA